MRVLITGISGFLGQWFMRHHVERGDFVAGVDIVHSAGGWSTFYEQDAGRFFEEFKGDFDIAYHFAAPVGGRMKIEGDPLFNADSLRLDSMFFRWAIDHTGLAVYPSSSAVYPVWHQGMGDADTDSRTIPLSEPYFLPDNDLGLPDQMYGFTKAAGEMLAFTAAKYGLNTLCIRPFSGYGEGQPDDYPMTAICKRAIARVDPLIVWGSGTQVRDFVHVSDVVAATQARMDANVDGYQYMNIGTGIGTSFLQLAQLAAGIVGYMPDIRVDTTKPEGVRYRVSDPRYMEAYYRPVVELEDGLGRVLDWLRA